MGPDPRAGVVREGIVEVRLRLSTALGLDDMPAQVPGWGTVLAGTARELLERHRRSEWRMVLTDDDGRLLRVLLPRRRPPRPADRPAGPHRPEGRRGTGSNAIVELQAPATLLAALTPDDHGAWAPMLHELQRRLAADHPPDQPPDQSPGQPPGRHPVVRPTMRRPRPWRGGDVPAPRWTGGCGSATGTAWRRAAGARPTPATSTTPSTTPWAGRACRGTAGCGAATTTAPSTRAAGGSPSPPRAGSTSPPAPAPATSSNHPASSNRSPNPTPATGPGRLPAHEALDLTDDEDDPDAPRRPRTVAPSGGGPTRQQTPPAAAARPSSTRPHPSEVGRTATAPASEHSDAVRGRRRVWTWARRVGLTLLVLVVLVFAVSGAYLGWDRLSPEQLDVAPPGFDVDAAGVRSTSSTGPRCGRPARRRWCWCRASRSRPTSGPGSRRCSPRTGTSTPTTCAATGSPTACRPTTSRPTPTSSSASSRRSGSSARSSSGTRRASRSPCRWPSGRRGASPASSRPTGTAPRTSGQPPL